MAHSDIDDTLATNAGPDAADEKVGRITVQRYEAIVAELTLSVGAESTSRWLVGDRALEMEPIMPVGAVTPQHRPEDASPSVERSLRRLADDIGVPYGTLVSRRWTASRWPAEHRVSAVPQHIHQILAGIADEQERFATIADPPLDERTGRRRWTGDLARRQVGYRAQRPETPVEKVNAIHHLAVDDEVAAQVAADLLRRPAVAAQVAARVPAAAKVEVIRDLTRDEQVAAQAAASLLQRPNVAFQAMADQRARAVVNHAQVERGRQAREDFHRTNPVAPVVRRVEHTIEFLDLVGACHAFVAKASRTVPGLVERQVTGDEQAVLSENVARVRATLEWIETALSTGRADMDAELARLLRGE